MDKAEIVQGTRQILERYDPADPGPTAAALRALWLQATPGRAPGLDAGEKKLMRDWGIPDPHFEAAGTPVPVLTAIGQEVGRRARRQVPAFLTLARRLWDQFGREGRVVAVFALGPMELADPETVVPIVYELATTCVFWEDCDQLAMRALEPVLRREPEAWLDRIGAWITDENKWVRRAGLTAVGRLPMAHPEYAARCVALAAPALGDPDTDVKRALGFALRLAARGDPEPVKAFLRAQSGATDADSLWVLADVIRSLWPPLLPEFADLLSLYRAWLKSAEPKARRGLEGAIRLLEGA